MKPFQWPTPTSVYVNYTTGTMTPTICIGSVSSTPTKIGQSIGFLGPELSVSTGTSAFRGFLGPEISASTGTATKPQGFVGPELSVGTVNPLVPANGISYISPDGIRGPFAQNMSTKRAGQGPEEQKGQPDWFLPLVIILPILGVIGIAGVARLVFVKARNYKLSKKSESDIEAFTKQSHACKPRVFGSEEPKV
ncbi:hypothetical protein P280DRAFT_37775 [Massarina eburnea CBS 473.64]|uniref:Uncharacterized protein n=1 Tax=Massarina eburnea CBS 473.64 TaxID=1395130 RepID=A0A6A6RXG0_9PLEO|nr:hypothetical protein P280DRAFT_37775 [Massarina eburnea CBS 473.64]